MSTLAKLTHHQRKGSEDRILVTRRMLATNNLLPTGRNKKTQMNNNTPIIPAQGCHIGSQRDVLKGGGAQLEDKKKRKKDLHTIGTQHSVNP